MIKADRSFRTTPENGKGGSFATRLNPFKEPTVVNSAPDLAEVSGLGASIDVLLRAGCALIVGRTRDGGALVLTILDGPQRHRTYCSTVDELDEAITSIFETYRQT